AFRMLIDLFGGAQMDAKDALKLADAMMGRDQWKRTVEFLDPFLNRAPADYRLRYLRAIAKNEDGRPSEAIADLLQIATAKEELPEVLQKKTAPAPTSEWLASFEKHYPPGMRKVMEVVQNSYTARQHIYRRQQGGSQPGGGSGVQIPQNVEQARNCALIHLIILTQAEKPEAKARLVQDLRKAGFTAADTLFTIEIDEQRQWSLTISEDALKAHPSDELLHATWITLNGYSRQTTAGIETCRQSYELFKSKYPALAIMAGNMAVRSDLKEGTPILEEALKKIESGELNDQSEFNGFSYMLASLLGGGQRVTTEEKMDLPEDLRKRIRAVLVAATKPREAKPGAAKSMWGLSPLVCAANALRAENAWEDYIRLWDDQFAMLHQADATKRKAMASWSLYASSSQPASPLLAALEFPPLCQSLPGVFAVMMRYDDPYNTQVEQWHHPGPQDEYAPVAKLLDTVKDPALRLVLAYKANQTPLVEAALAARVGVARPDADDLLLAASYYSAKGDHARAAEFLLRCVALPMEAAQRKDADGALAFAVTSMTDEQRKALPAAGLEAAQQATRRLRSGQLSVEQREELAIALAKLGLKEEAEQWKRLAAATPAPAASSSTAVSSRQPRVDKLEQLIEQKAE
ncbi:MAG: hypothetical protein ACOYMN_24160, partial [Roseimicrobium sp.]